MSVQPSKAVDENPDVGPVEANLQEHQLHALKQGPPETKGLFKKITLFNGGGGGVYYVQIVRLKLLEKNSTTMNWFNLIQNAFKAWLMKWLVDHVGLSTVFWNLAWKTSLLRAVLEY